MLALMVHGNHAEHPKISAPDFQTKGRLFRGVGFHDRLVERGEVVAKLLVFVNACKGLSGGV